MIECQVDDYTPLPTSAGKQPPMDYAALRERAAAACAAAVLLDAEGYESPPPSIETIQEFAHDTMLKTARGADISVESAVQAMNTPEGAYYIDSILSAYDMDAVGEAKRLRNYVTNKLILETTNTDARVRLRALELLGKISNVGLFTERTEITVNNRSTVELENTLKEKVRRLLNSGDAEDAKIIDHPVLLAGAPSVSSELSGL